MINIALFASGNGSNVATVLKKLHKKSLNVGLIVSNNPEANVLNIAKKHEVPTLIIKKNEFYQTEKIIQNLEEYKIEWIFLAGFLWLIPHYLIQKYPYKIVNIHPSLLPKYGGKGMYGAKVHDAVWEHGEKETGITIHYVNEKYDEGQIVFQTKCKLNEIDTPDIIAKKVHDLEYEYYPIIIKKLISGEKV